MPFIPHLDSDIRDMLDTIGVSNIDKSLDFYQNILGYDEVVYDKTDSFNCFTANAVLLPIWYSIMLG